MSDRRNSTGSLALLLRRALIGAALVLPLGLSAMPANAQAKATAQAVADHFSRVGAMTASFRCLGGIDVDAAALADFERLAGVRGTRLDLFDREQYRAFHGAEPPAGWREATSADIHQAFGQ